MNVCIFAGRLTHDPKFTERGESSVCRFAIATRRYGKSKAGEPEADFPMFAAFGKTGRAIAQYCKKGDRVCICAEYRSGSYTKKDGTKAYTNEFIVREIEFTDTRQNQEEPPKQEDKYGDAEWHGRL